jgi:hypothetical protein
LPELAAVLAVAVVVVVAVVIVIVAAGLVVDEPAPAFALGLRCAGFAPVAQLRALRFLVGPAVACAFVLIAVVGTGFCLGPWLRVAVFAPVAQTPMY